jgi:hypothetical protein
VKRQLTLCARSPLGTWLALLLVTSVLLLFGLEIAHQAMDGVFYTKLPPNSLGTGRLQTQTQNSVNTLLTNVTDHMKKYERADLLTKYGIGIFVGFVAVGLLGGIIRTYRFDFRPAKDGGVIERRSMWLFIPLLWITRSWRRLWTWIPVRSLRNFRIPLIDLYIPGFKKRIPCSRVKRLEIQSGAEGGTSLVLTFRDERAWTIARGRQKRLQRIGSVAGRAMGLQRRDLLTWS